jgi:ribonuclease HI
VRVLPQDPGFLTIWCDGAARGNPGPSGYGVQITDADGEVVAEIAGSLGETTNNVAEYTAAIEGLRRAADLGATEVLLRSDSQLLINQITGRYKVRTEHLRPLHAQVLEQARRFLRVRFEHVRREGNTEADRLANEGVDAWLADRQR